MRGETLKLNKDKRRESIRQQIDSNPFITDNELSDLFQV
ncbi:transcription factor FapR, partial [Staphylococcus aureus]|nr:transcription factor FapR [Staphylococcus aureus]